MNVVRWPDQSAVNAKAVAEVSTQLRFLYSLDVTACMYTDSEHVLALLLQMAALGDWTAIDILADEDILPSSARRPLEMLDTEPLYLPYAVCAWRRGDQDLARRIWANCPHPEAQVELVVASEEYMLADEPEARVSMLQQCADCELKTQQIAIEMNDAVSLENAGHVIYAGRAYLGLGDQANAVRVLAGPSSDEAAVRVLLAACPHLYQDETLLQQLAARTTHGKCALGNLKLRQGQREEAEALFRQAGFRAAGYRLVAMGACTEHELLASINVSSENMAREFALGNLLSNTQFN
jgi:hypothetical protein